jgi:hypothetical protein
MLLHLPCLVSADGGFQSKKMLNVDPCRLSQDLAPAIFTCALDAQHCQQARIEQMVCVFLAAGEQKIWFCLSFRCCRAIIANLIFSEYYFQMVFQSKTDAALSAIQSESPTKPFERRSANRCFSSVRKRISSRSIHAISAPSGSGNGSTSGNVDLA